MFALSVPAPLRLDLGVGSPRALVRNAVALNATTMNLARVIGVRRSPVSSSGRAGIAAAYFTMLGGYGLEHSQRAAHRRRRAAGREPRGRR